VSAVILHRIALFSPHAVFGAAQVAIARRDWATFFGCFDPHDLRRFAASALATYAREMGTDDPWLSAHCLAHGTSLNLLGGLGGGAMRAALERLEEPAAFVAPLIARLQAAGRRCPVSTALFLGETLEGLVIEGGTACATRTLRGASLGVVKFLRGGDGWRLRLFWSATNSVRQIPHAL
jgi:hypothetical protein